MNRKFTALMGCAHVLIASFIVGGCASTGPKEEELVPIQVIQMGDDALDCASLQSEVFKLERVVSQLTQEIEGHKDAARANDAAASVSSYLGGSSTVFSTLMAGASRDAATDKREIRDSYQRRRDVLLQQYMHKQCSVRATTAGS